MRQLVLLLILIPLLYPDDLRTKLASYYEISGLNRQAADFPGVIKRGFDMGLAQSGKELDNDTKQRLSEHIDTCYSVNNYLDSSRAFVVRDITVKEVDLLLKFHNSSLARDITKLELESSGPGFVDRALAFDTGTLDPLLKKELDKIISALRLVDNTCEVYRGTYTGMFYGMNMSAAPGEVKGESEIAGSVKETLKQNLPQVKLLVKKNTYYVYKDVPLRKIKKYVKFLTSRPYLKFHTLRFEHQKRFFTEATRCFNTKMATLTAK